MSTALSATRGGEHVRKEFADIDALRGLAAMDTGVAAAIHGPEGVVDGVSLRNCSLSSAVCPNANWNRLVFSVSAFSRSSTAVRHCSVETRSALSSQTASAWDRS